MITITVRENGQYVQKEIECICPCCDNCEVYSAHHVCPNCVASTEEDWVHPEDWAKCVVLVGCMQAIEATHLHMLMNARGRTQ